MIPAALAAEIRTTLLSYLTTFNFTDQPLSVADGYCCAAMPPLNTSGWSCRMP